MPERSEEVLVASGEDVTVSLDAVPSGDAGGGPPPSPRIVDLINPGTLFVNRLPDMTTVMDRVFRHIKSRIFQEFRRDVELDDEWNEIATHDRYLGQWSRPGGQPARALFGVVNIEPLAGFSIITVGGEVLAALVDDLFGATEPGKALAPTSSEISAMETRIGSRLFKIVGDAVTNTFQQYFETRVSLVRTEGHAALATVSDAAEPFFVMGAKIGMPTGEGAISVAIPYRGLEPFAEILASPVGGQAQQGAASLWKARLSEAMDGVPVEVAFEVGSSSVSAAHLAALKVGDVLPLRLHENARVVAGGAQIAELENYGGLDDKYGVLF